MAFDNAPRHTGPRSNLPIPRELRDLIWPHLLYHENLHDEPYRNRPDTQRSVVSDANERSLSRAHTFTFHPAILAVNRQINAEAKEILKENHFVKVSHEGPFAARDRHRFHIPIVCESESHLLGMDCHVMRLKVTASEAMLEELGRRSTTHRVNVVHRHTPSTFCVIAHNLPLVCQMMQHLFLLSPWSGHAVTSTDGVRQFHDVEEGVLKRSMWPVEGLVFRTAISVTGDPTTTATKLLVKRLMPHFRRMTHPGQEVVVSGMDSITFPAEQLQALRRLMGPRIVWINALAWYMLKRARENTDAADALVRADKYDEAILLYARARELGVAFFHHKWTVETYKTTALLPMGLLSKESVNAAIAEAFLRMRLGGPHLDHLICYDHGAGIIGQPHVHHLYESGFIQTVVRPNQGPLYRQMHNGENAIGCYYMTCLNRQNFLSMRIGGLTMLNWLRDVQPHFTDPWFQHDCALIERLASDAEFRSGYLLEDDPTRFKSSIYELTSAYCLPVRLPHKLRDNLWEKPKGIEGLVDWRRLWKHVFGAAHPCCTEGLEQVNQQTVSCIVENALDKSDERSLWVERYWGSGADIDT